MSYKTVQKTTHSNCTQHCSNISTEQYHSRLLNIRDIDESNSLTLPFSGVWPKQSIQFHSLVSVISSNSFRTISISHVYGTKWKMSGFDLVDQSSIRSKTTHFSFFFTERAWSVIKKQQLQYKCTTTYSVILSTVSFYRYKNVSHKQWKLSIWICPVITNHKLSKWLKMHYQSVCVYYTYTAHIYK